MCTQINESIDVIVEELEKITLKLKDIQNKKDIPCIRQARRCIVECIDYLEKCDD